MKDPSRTEKVESTLRVFRGCGWNGYAPNLVAAYRSNYPPDNRYILIGFRPVRTSKEKP